MFGFEFLIGFTSSYKDEVRRSHYRLTGHGQFFRYHNQTLTHHFGIKHALFNDIFNPNAFPLSRMEKLSCKYAVPGSRSMQTSQKGGRAVEKQKNAGRAKGRACKRLFKYLNPTTSEKKPVLSKWVVKMFHTFTMFIRCLYLCAAKDPTTRWKLVIRSCMINKKIRFLLFN